MAAEKPAKGEPALMKDLFFYPPETTDGKWIYKLCEGALTWRGSNSGYSAFVQHMTGSHSSTWRRDLNELKSNNARNGNLDGYVRRTVSDKAINLFNWIDWVVFENLSFSVVENPRTRKYSSLQPITADTLMKHMGLLSQRVLEKLKEREASTLMEKRRAVLPTYTLEWEVSLQLYDAWRSRGAIR